MASPSFVTLSCLSWNVQGLGESDKCDRVRAAVASANPCIVCLQESKLACLDAPKLASFLPSHLSAFSAKNADGSRGGVITAWDPCLFALVSSTSSRFSHTVTLRSTTTDLSFMVTNVYAPADHSLMGDFVLDTQDVAAGVNLPWLVMGDFNLIRSPQRRTTVTTMLPGRPPLTP